MRTMLRNLVGVATLALGLLVSPAYAVTSASFVFDTVSDPGDLPDGPDYDVTGIGPIDDGSGCDAVVMVMVDPTGTPTDIDTFCLSLVTGLGGSDGDYGSIETGYVPVASPVTYALFDINAADIAATAGLNDTNVAYFNYVVANGRLLAENTFAVGGVPTQPPFLFGFVTGEAIPTIGELGLGLLAVLMLGAFAWQTRQRRAVR